MESNEYKAWCDNIVATQFPFKAVEPQNILATGHNSYSVNGVELGVSQDVAQQLDRYIGMTGRQTQDVTKAFGVDGVNNVRNYLMLSKKVGSTDRFALIADPEKRQIVGLTPIKKEPIPVEAFFAFLDMFMNKNGYYPYQVTTSMDNGSEVMVLLAPNNPIYQAFAPEEEFLTNGIWFRWNLGEVEAGNFFIRLICKNGAIETVQHSLAHAHQLDSDSIRKLLQLPADQFFLNNNFNAMKANALIAMNTPASLKEVKAGNKLLLDHGVAVEDAETIIPYKQLEQMYADAGYEHSQLRLEETHSNINAWELYNRLTHFATHNPEWLPDDIRRSSLMYGSSQLLRRPRDIRQYTSIFG